MKNIIKLVFLLSFFVSDMKLSGQSVFQIKGIYDSESSTIRLRWAPPSYKHLKHARQYGYRIEKTMISLGNNPIPSEEQTIDSIIIMPYNEEAWEANGLVGPEADAAKELLTDFGFKVNDNTTIPYDQIQNKKLIHAVQNFETQKNQYAYTLLMADRDINFAKALGLAYLDANLENEAVYSYKITLQNITQYIADHGSMDFDAAITEVSTNPGSSTLPAPHTLTAEPSNKKIRVSWSIAGMENEYSFFNIYRSVGSSAFTKVNANPYVFMSQDEKATIVSYNDSIPQNGVAYTYRVTGISPFGGESPYSDPVTATGVPDPLSLGIEIKSITESKGKIFLDWKAISKSDSLPPSLATITGYVIMHTLDPGVSPTTVKTIASNTATKDSLSTLTDGYYIVSATDVNGYVYPSAPHFFQAVDSIAPAAPTGLQARLNIDGTVRLKWAANTEADLQGYRVFYSYFAEGPFAQTTSIPHVGTTYFTKNFGSSAQDSVYFAIRAVDKRENASELSAATLMLLPDNIAPSSPVLAQVLPRPEGMRIGWALSRESDIDVHYLQRKVKEATQWTNILTITDPSRFPKLPLTPAETNPSNYVDTTTLKLRTYSYRLVSFDKSGNQSVSDVVNVKPFDDGIRGSVRPFKAKQILKNQTYTANPMSAIGGGPAVDLSNTNLGVHNMGYVKGNVISDGKVAELTWEYDTKFANSLSDFSIYQKVDLAVTNTNTNLTSPVDPNPYVLIRTIDHVQAKRIAMANGKTGYMVHVEGLNPEKYISLIPLVPDPKPGNNSSPLPGAVPNVSSPFMYKIVANHRDGGWSEPVVTPLIKTQ